MAEQVLEAIWILRQNTPFSQKKELDLLLENSKAQVHSSLLGTLYKQIESVRRIDFADIDKSKGSYTKLSFYKTLEDAHKYLAEEADATKLEVVTLAKKNLISMKGIFEDAYKIGSDLAVLTYQTMVMAVLDATSSLITRTATSVVKTKDKCSELSLNVLKKFNNAVKSGKMRTALSKVNENYLITSGAVTVAKEEVVATALGITAGAIVALAFVPLIRELIFYFYAVRMRIADYLDQLVMYIKINEVEVKNNSKFDAAKKKDIIEKQEAWIARLDQISDKIRVNQALGEKTSKEQIKKGNSELTLKNVKDDIAEAPPSTDGFDF